MGCVANSQFNPQSNKRGGEKECSYATSKVKAQLEARYGDILKANRLQIREGNLTLGALMKFRDITTPGGFHEPCSYDPDSSIYPDGKFLYVVDSITEELKWVIGTSEAKTQGTNKGRIEANLDAQEVGNAVCREGKNIRVIRSFYKHLGFIPYVIFATGCDFAEGVKTTRNYLSGLNEGGLLNHTYLDSSDYVSIYYQEDIFSIEETTDILFKVFNNSFKYYVNNFLKKTKKSDKHKSAMMRSVIVK